MSISKVYASVGIAPSTGGLTFQLYKNGSNVGLFTISSGQFTLAPNTVSISLATTDYLTMSITSGVSSDLVVELQYAAV